MTFEDFRAVFFVIVAGFIVFVVLNIFLMKWRWKQEAETRAQRLREAQSKPGSGSTSPDGALHSTFGFSGVSASDSAPAGNMGAMTPGTGFESSDCDPGDTGGDCGDSGSDSGGGDSGGGGWND